MANTEKNAKRYAKALFNKIELDRIENAVKRLKDISELIKNNKEIQAAFVSPLFTREEKGNVVDVISNSMDLSEEMRKYLHFISIKGAAGLLDEIVKHATAIYHEKKKKARATVITPIAFTDEFGERLRAALRKITSRDVDIEYTHDPSLLGGFVVKVGSTMYDGSLKGQLRLLKDELIKL